MFNLVMADELGRELESLVRLELGLLGLNTRSVLLRMSRVVGKESMLILIF